MGKKWNILRQRIDSCNYETSQLLVGTVVFTTLLFLLPTTTVFAAVFLCLRVGQCALQLVVRTMVVGINWSTFASLRILDSIGRDHSLLDVRVEIGEGVRRGEGEGVERGGGDGVWVVWNGRRWSVREMAEIVERCEVESVLGDVVGGRGGGGEITDHHLATISGIWTTL